MGLPRNEEYVYYIEEPSNRTIYTPITGNPDEQASPTETSNVSSDQSTSKTIPSINWDADNVTPVGEGSNGDEGVAPPSYPNVNPDPVPVIRYKTVTRVTRVAVEDFSHSALEALHNQGVTFVVIYTDGTEDDVDWTEVYDPQVITTSSITFDADNIGAASNQHFWDDTNGAHVTDDEQDDWNAEYAKTGHGDLANPTDLEPWHNILMNSLGILLRRGLVNLVSFSKSAIAFYDGSGNQNGNITAFFGRNNAQIGRDTEKHLVLNSSGITVYNGDGTVAPLQASNISAAEANIQQLQANTADISTIRANSAKVNNLTADQLNAASGYIESLTSSNVTVNDISANKATIASLISGDVTVDTLRSASGYIGNLTSSNVTANDISTNKATIASLISDNVTVDTLRAASAFIASLASSNISASNIVADHADISDLKATKVNVSDLEADYITASTIESTYMKADISNADVAWIQNGVIKDGSISNAMIASVSANKLTAGTIDASNITVTNLNADNITTGTINGQRIGEGSLSLSKLEDDVYTEAEVDAKLSNMQTQIDGAIETWTGTAVPTLNNTPASSWTDTATKHNHVGDVYFVVNSSSQQNGYNYRFTESGTYPNTTYSWQLIKDNDVTNALSRLTTAEGKIGTIEQFDSDISAWKTDTDEELSSIKSNHTALAGRVTTAEGTLTTKVDTTTFNTLSQTVEGNTSSIQSLTTEQTTLSGRIDNAQAAIDNIKIGGRNLLRKTGSFIADDISLTKSSVPETGIIRITSTSSTGSAKFKVNYLDFSEYGNDTYVVSFDARLAPVESSYTNAHLIVYLGFSIASRINNVFSSSYDRYCGYTFEADKLSSDWQRFTKSYNVPGDIKSGQSSALVAGSQMSVQFSVGGARKPVEVRLVKLERGTRATDWTPAPEDIESQITKNTTKINEVTDTVDGHTQRIGSLETTIVTKADGSSLETVSNRLNDVSDTVDGHTQSITVINSTLSSKADGSAVSSLTTRVNNISDTVDGHTSDISRIDSTVATKADSSTVSTLQSDYASYKQTTDEFKSQVGTTYATKTELGTAQTTLQTNIDNIKVGGENLLVLDTTQLGRLLEDGSVYTTGSNDGQQHLCSDFIKIEPGSKYVLTRYIKDTVRAHAYFYVNWYDIDKQPILRTDVIDYADDDPGYDVFTAPDNAEYVRISMGDRFVSLSAVKFEKGTVPTDWSPSNYDTNNAFNILRGTNQQDVLTGYHLDGSWKEGHWSISSGGATNGGAIGIEIDDFIDNSGFKIRYGFRVWSTTSGNKDVSQGGLINVLKAGLYRLILAVRLTPDQEQTSATLQIRTWGNGAAQTTSTSAITSTEWRIASFSINLTTKYANLDGLSLFIGVRGKGSLDICRIYLKEGYRAVNQPCMTITDESVYLPWRPALEDNAPYTQTNALISAVEERVTTAETSITQTNEAITLKANASDVYTKTQTDGLISTEVSNRNTAIEQSASAIQLSVSETYSTKNDTSQMTKPNLSPYFSCSLGNLYNATTNPNGYWLYYSSMNNWTNLNDGWAHVEVTAGSSTAYANYYVQNIPDWLKPSTQYTYMVEWRNVDTTNLNTYIAVATDYATQEDAFSGGTIYTNITTSEGFTYLTVTSLSDLSNAVIFSRGYAGIRANSTLIGDFRISLYEGTYAGLYKPYIDQSLINRVNSAEATLTVQAGQISSKVSADGVISSINQSAETVKIQASKVEIDGAAVFSNSAFKSAADAAYDAKGSAAAVQTNLNNLSVGGRNLLIDSGNMSGNQSSNSPGITVSNGVVTWSRTEVAWPWFVLTKTAIPIENIPAGKELILSVELRKTTDEVQSVYAGLCTVSSINSPSPRLRYTSNAGYGHLDTDLEGMDITSDWVRYKTRFSTDYDIWRGQTSATEVGVVAYMYHHAIGTIQIRKPKLEFGNKDTDWTPAPEDVDNDISIAKTSADIVVSVYPVSIDWNTEIATLGVRCLQKGQLITPTGYSWTRDSLTSVLGTAATLEVTDLDAVYNCTVTFNV